MRLWHKDMIRVLPRKQLLAQWRECCAIVGNINKRGTPNHILVNPILNYTKSHFYLYCCMVCDEMFRRGYKVSDSSRKKILDYVSDEEIQDSSRIEKDGTLFKGWHNERYFWQCFYNLQEKFDRGAVDNEEFARLVKFSKKYSVKNGSPEIKYIE